MAEVSGKIGSTAWNKLTKFVREVRAEMRRVAWPNREELVTYTLVVIASVIVIAVFLGVVDVVISNLLSLLGKIGR